MRGEEDELHAADEIGAGHHHERRIAERDLDRRRRPRYRRCHRTSGGGSGMLSTLPAYQAAGSIATDSITKPAMPVRQP